MPEKLTIPPPPPHTRLILTSENLLDQWGTRTERGERITVEWGEQRPEGWYEPVFTVNSDDTLATLVASAKAWADADSPDWAAADDALRLAVAALMERVTV